MASEPYPEIVLDISMSPPEALSLIKQKATEESFLRIINEVSTTTWEFARLDGKGNIEAKFELFLENRYRSCRLYFSADSAEDSFKLHSSVATSERRIQRKHRAWS